MTNIPCRSSLFKENCMIDPGGREGEVPRESSDIKKAVVWFSKVEDPDPREGILRETVETWPAEDVAALFMELTDAIQQATHRSVYITLLRVLVTSNPISVEAKADIYSIATAVGRPDAVRILLTVPPRSTAHDDELRVDPGIEEMPLGMQKWRARGRDHDLLSRLALVPNPDVLRIWLENPRTTEQEVLRVGARRPASGLCLLEILKSKRWAARARLQEALAQNPYTPSNVAAGLLHLLRTPLLEKVALTGVLHELVRETAKEIVERRRRQG